MRISDWSSDVCSSDLFEGHKTFINLVPPNEMTELIGFREDITTALVNLFANAIHWLEDSQPPDPRIDVRIAWDGADALIYVEDNGPGIPEEYVGRVFDIRFTLKDGGTGQIGRASGRDRIGQRVEC